MRNLKILNVFALTVLSFGLLATISFAQSTSQLTDPEIASAAVTANQIDVNIGVLALKKSNDPVVRKFALDMVSDHTSVIQQAVALARKLGVTPESNAITKSLLQGAEKTTRMLKPKWGSDFDKAYINHEVAYHKAVIKAVKNVLIPQTKNSQLKNLLKKVAPVLNHHLMMAENAQSEIE